MQIGGPCVSVLELYQSKENLVIPPYIMKHRYIHTHNRFLQSVSSQVQQRLQLFTAGDSITVAHNEMKIIDNTHAQSHVHTHVQRMHLFILMSASKTSHSLIILCTQMLGCSSNKQEVMSCPITGTDGL